MEDDGEKLAVGRIVKAFGVKGELVVEVLADSPDRFRSLRRVFVGPSPDSSRSVTVEVTSIEPRGVRLRLDGVHDRTAAGALAGHYLFVGPGERIRPPRGRYFVHEIVGLRVIDQDGVERGEVRDVQKAAGHDLYVVARPGGGEFLLPAVREFIRKVDTAAGVLHVSLIEGLIEE